MTWQKGPLPPDTWMWGGVVPVGVSPRGFYFADFHGDHVTVNPGTPEAKDLKSEEVAWYCNCLCLPPTGSGGVEGYSFMRCPLCQGTGKITDPSPPSGQAVVTVRCPECEGRGWVGVEGKKEEKKDE